MLTAHAVRERDIVESRSERPALAITARRWEALLLVMDSRPFPDLHHILQEINDDRVWVYAEWVRRATLHLGLLPARFPAQPRAPGWPQAGVEYTPKVGGQWTSKYHGLLYNLTDEAIRGRLATLTTCAHRLYAS